MCRVLSETNRHSCLFSHGFFDIPNNPKQKMSKNFQKIATYVGKKGWGWGITSLAIGHISGTRHLLPGQRVDKNAHFILIYYFNNFWGTEDKKIILIIFVSSISFLLTVHILWHGSNLVSFIFVTFQLPNFWKGPLVLPKSQFYISWNY